MTAKKLREWRGVKDVAGPAGAAVTTRLRTTPQDDLVLNTVAAHNGTLRRRDLAACSRPEPLPEGLDPEGRRKALKDRLSVRKKALTSQSSARMASTIIRDNDAQYKRERDNQKRHIAAKKAAIAAIRKRLAAPAQDSLTAAERSEREERKEPKGYASRAECHAKRQRMHMLQAQLARVEADYAAGIVHIVEGGKRLARARHNLDAAGLTKAEWDEQWWHARWCISANGSGDEPFGNLTITVTPDGQASIRLPRPLENLANAKRGRYVLSGTVVFRHRGEEWKARIAGGQSVRYSFTRQPRRAGVYLTASWANDPAAPLDQAGSTAGIVAVDTNDGFFAVRRLDQHGNPVGAPYSIDFGCTGSSGYNDAQVRHALARLIRYCRRYKITTIAIEDLNFEDARQVGCETMGRGQRGKRFRRTVAGIPTAVIRNRLTSMASRASIRLIAVNPAYTSQWGGQHWRKPYKNVTRHEAAATMIGRRAQGHKARRKGSGSRVQPAYCTAAAADLARPSSRQANTGSRPRSGTRGTESRPPSRQRTRTPECWATVTPGLVNNGQFQQSRCHFL
jgi:IS605 OrfB family transposase